MQRGAVRLDIKSLDKLTETEKSLLKRCVRGDFNKTVKNLQKNLSFLKIKGDMNDVSLARILIFYLFFRDSKGCDGYSHITDMDLNKILRYKAPKDLYTLFKCFKRRGIGVIEYEFFMSRLYYWNFKNKKEIVTFIMSKIGEKNE
jgi:hypothetical protein